MPSLVSKSRPFGFAQGRLWGTRLFRKMESMREAIGLMEKVRLQFEASP